MDKQLFDDLAAKISSTLPPIPAKLSDEIETNIRRVLRSTFDKMELVTREDFEIQSAVLQKTRLKLEALENKIQQMEQQLNQQD